MTRKPSYSRQEVLGRFVLECFAEPVIVLDRSGSLVDSNRAAQDALAAGAIPELDAAERDQRIAEFLRAVDATGGSSLEIWQTTQEGRNRRLLLDGFAIDEFRVVVARDVTRRREQDEEVRHLRRMQSLGFITASIAHDFNNVLVPIRCLSGLLARELQEGSRAAGLAAEVQSAAERAAWLVRDVRAMVRARPSAPEAVDLTELLLGIRPIVERLLGDDVDLMLAVDSALGEVSVDRERLEHALLNLIANARDAMPRGGRVTISAANVALVAGRASDAESAANAYVTLTVEDTGIGMTPDDRAHAFERFYTTKDRAGGTGLGLASVYRFVTDTGGLISLQSEPGHGTTVTIHLPRAGRRERPTLPDLLPRDVRGGDETVLVVDRDESVRLAVRAVLESRGYRVLDADSPDSSVPIARSSEPPVALALVDAALPRSNYFTFLPELRSVMFKGRILLMSTDTSARLERIRSACDGLLTKGFSEADLVRAVRSALDTRSPAEQSSIRK
jgi:two-component system, cell cycle sensor histidine kinase and response regulator CckA